MAIHPVFRKLKEQRKASGTDVHDVAERAGYTAAFIHKIECGDRLPSFAALTAWADTLGLELTVKPKE